MSRLPVVVVWSGAESSVATRLSGSLGATTLELRADQDPGEVISIARRSVVVWLPRGAIFDEAIVKQLSDWVGRFGAEDKGRIQPRCLRARLELHYDVGSIRLPRTIVASIGPSFALQFESMVSGPGVPTDRLSKRWRVIAPGTLTQHLADLDAESQILAGLAFELGMFPGPRDFLVVPLRLLVRGFLFAHGERRRALPRAILAAYRSILIAIKTWERGLGPDDAEVLAAAQPPPWP